MVRIEVEVLTLPRLVAGVSGWDRVRDSLPAAASTQVNRDSFEPLFEYRNRLCLRGFQQLYRHSPSSFWKPLSTAFFGFYRFNPVFNYFFLDLWVFNPAKAGSRGFAV
jgi:hypothetical protein